MKALPSYHLSVQGGDTAHIFVCLHTHTQRKRERERERGREGEREGEETFSFNFLNLLCPSLPLQSLPNCQWLQVVRVQCTAQNTSFTLSLSLSLRSVRLLHVNNEIGGLSSCYVPEKTKKEKQEKQKKAKKCPWTNRPRIV